MAVAKVLGEPTYQLSLTSEEAGYLLDLLYAHVGGELSLYDQPLGTIRTALDEAGVERILAVNRKSGYASLYRDVDWDEVTVR